MENVTVKLLSAETNSIKTTEYSINVFPKVIYKNDNKLCQNDLLSKKSQITN